MTRVLNISLPISLNLFDRRNRHGRNENEKKNRRDKFNERAIVGTNLNNSVPFIGSCNVACISFVHIICSFRRQLVWYIWPTSHVFFLYIVGTIIVHYYLLFPYQLLTIPCVSARS